jgi:hypothetical protein
VPGAAESVVAWASVTARESPREAAFPEEVEEVAEAVEAATCLPPSSAPEEPARRERT